MAIATRRTGSVASACSGTDDLRTAQRLVYDAETTLHAARQSGIDSWVAAAYDRLHESLAAHAALEQLAA